MYLKAVRTGVQVSCDNDKNIKIVENYTPVEICVPEECESIDLLAEAIRKVADNAT